MVLTVIFNAKSQQRNVGVSITMVMRSWELELLDCSSALLQVSTYYSQELWIKVCNLLTMTTDPLIFFPWSCRVMRFLVRGRTMFFISFLVPLSSCEYRVETASGGKLALWNHIPFCAPDGSFQNVQCNARSGNCWCVSNNGLECTETQSKTMPNCITPSKQLISF